MYALRGDTVAFALVSSGVTLMEREIAAHRGRVVKRLGDGVLAAFEKVESALHATQAVFTALANAETGSAQEPLHVRFAISHGMAVVAGTDVFGDVVNVAARLLARAAPDEVLLSGEACESLGADFGGTVQLIDSLAVSGRPSKISAYRFLWRNVDATTLDNRRARGTPRPVALQVVCAGASYVLGTNRRVLTIGRSSENDIVVNDSTVSRKHATLLARENKFSLVDTSSNGTDVEPNNGQKLRVVREEVTLSSSGTIVVGAGSDARITYRTAPVDELEDATTAAGASPSAPTKPGPSS